MLDAISAEALKFRRHRATWGLVWIWPIGLTIIMLLAIFIDLANGAAGETSGRPTAAGWIADSIGFWNVPGHPLGRYLIGAFVAVVFAGEYGWNTWKLIFPTAPAHAHRGQICRRLGLARDRLHAGRHPVQRARLGRGRGHRRSDPGRHRARRAVEGARPRRASLRRAGSPHHRLCEPRRDPHPLDRRRSGDRAGGHHARAAVPGVRADARAYAPSLVERSTRRARLYLANSTAG